jgi:hypothetical protein
MSIDFLLANAPLNQSIAATTRMIKNVISMYSPAVEPLSAIAITPFARTRERVKIEALRPQCDGH